MTCSCAGNMRQHRVFLAALQFLGDRDSDLARKDAIERAWKLEAQVESTINVKQQEAV